jgi:hypothetical protein
MLGYITFLLAYTFLINSIGILLMTLLSFWIVAIFYSINILSALAYSAIEISYDRSKIKERVVKDLFFIALIVLLGILPMV